MAYNSDLNIILIGKREWGWTPLKGEETIFREDERAPRRRDGWEVWRSWQNLSGCGAYFCLQDQRRSSLVKYTPKSRKCKLLSRVQLFATPWCVYGILQARILEKGSHSLLQRIFPTQGSNLGLLYYRQILYHPESPGTPKYTPGGDYDNGFPSRGSGLQENNADSRKASSVFAFFQVPTTQNNQYSKVAYFGVVCPSLIAMTVTAFSEKILLKG